MAEKIVVAEIAIRIEAGTNRLLLIVKGEMKERLTLIFGEEQTARLLSSFPTIARIESNDPATEQNHPKLQKFVAHFRVGATGIDGLPSVDFVDPGGEHYYFAFSSEGLAKEFSDALREFLQSGVRAFHKPN